MTGIDGKRGEDGEDIALEEFPSPSDLSFVQLQNRAEVNAFLG